VGNLTKLREVGERMVAFSLWAFFKIGISHSELRRICHKGTKEPSLCSGQALHIKV
jgi:hypothetical protein